MEIDTIIKSVLKHYNDDVEKIFLFGSRARGETDEESDLDLIVVRRTRERFVERLGNAPNLPVPADIFVYTPEEFARMREHENPFILSALESAVELYSRI